MIDEKMIEEAAINASIEDTNKGIVRDGYVISAIADHELGFQEGFNAGISWFLDNLWHDVSEIPDKRKYILVEYGKGHIYNDAYCPYDVQWLYKDFTGEPWKQLVEYEKITRWLYIDDLLKGGK